LAFIFYYAEINLKSLHKCIKKVSQDIESFSFNTAVSKMMITVNELTFQKCRSRKILEPLVLVIAPFAPHIAEEIWEKISEEMEELKNAQKKNNKDEILEELGDTIFSLINLARFLGISADDALRKSNNKFINRFKMIEDEINKRGKNIEESSFNELEDIWNNIKKNNNS